MTMDVEGQRGDADKVLRLRRRRPETCSDLYYEPKNTVQGEHLLADHNSKKSIELREETIFFCMLQFSILL